MFSLLADAPPSSFFCPKLSPPAKGLDVLVAPKRLGVEVGELVIVFAPNKPAAGVFPVLLFSPKLGVFPDEAFEGLDVPNIDADWLPPVVKLPKRFFGAWDVAVDGWPNGEELVVVPAANEVPEVFCVVFDGDANGLEVPLLLADPKLNGADILACGDGCMEGGKCRRS